MFSLSSRGEKAFRDICFFSRDMYCVFSLTIFFHAKRGKEGKRLRGIGPLWWFGQHWVIIEVPEHQAWTKWSENSIRFSSWANGRVILSWLFYLIYLINYKYNVIKHLSTRVQLLEPLPIFLLSQASYLTVFFVLCIPFMSKMLLLNWSY